MTLSNKKNKILKIVGINLSIFLILFIIIDLILGYSRNPYDLNLFRIKHPYYHHGMMPNAKQFTAWGDHLYPITTNSMGFIDSTKYEVPLGTNNKRILIIGDSHSEGVGVKYPYTYAGILQKKAENLGIEVLNASAVSYSPKIHFLKVDYLINEIGLEVDEIWSFVDISDLQNEIAYEKFHSQKAGNLFIYKEKIKNVLKKNSFTYHSVHSMQETKRVNAFVDKMSQFDTRDVSNLQRNTVELYEDFFRDFDNDDLLRSPQFHGVGTWYYDSTMMDLAKKGLKLGQLNISRLDSLCDAHNIKLRLSVQPWHDQIIKQDTTDFYTKSWEMFCKQKEIDFINLFPLFINGENPYIVIEKYYIPNDNHWNEAGHEKVSEYLFNRYF